MVALGAGIFLGRSIGRHSTHTQVQRHYQRVNFSKEDRKHLDAARAWLELNKTNHAEALAELEEISSEGQVEREVLLVRMAAYLAAGKRESAGIIAEALKMRSDIDSRTKQG